MAPYAAIHLTSTTQVENANAHILCYGKAWAWKKKEEESSNTTQNISFTMAQF